MLKGSYPDANDTGMLGLIRQVTASGLDDFPANVETGTIVK